MSTTQDLITALKAELKAADITFADLADELGMSESSIKRILAKGDMPLSRIDEMLRVLKMDFAELARKVADAQPLRRELSAGQEAAVVADRKLLLLAICAFSQWSFEQMTSTYAISDAECVKYLVQLDKLGISASQAISFVERLQRVGQDFAQQHLAEQKLPADQKRSYTLVVGMRSWFFAAFIDLKRAPA